VFKIQLDARAKPPKGLGTAHRVRKANPRRQLTEEVVRPHDAEEG